MSKIVQICPVTSLGWGTLRRGNCSPSRIGSCRLCIGVDGRSFQGENYWLGTLQQSIWWSHSYPPWRRVQLHFQTLSPSWNAFFQLPDRVFSEFLLSLGRQIQGQDLQLQTEWCHRKLLTIQWWHGEPLCSVPWLPEGLFWIQDISRRACCSFPS